MKLLYETNIPGVTHKPIQIICDLPQGEDASVFLKKYYAEENFKIIEIREK